MAWFGLAGPGYLLSRPLRKFSLVCLLEEEEAHQRISADSDEESAIAAASFYCI